jgi:lipopolysaccharide biosynthesis glycosyltransferase
MGLKNYQNYFSAGVLVFNTEAFRNSVTFDEMMQLELHKKLPFADQEVLNIFCENKVQFASMDWNVMCAKCKAYPNPKLLHYVWDKPWKNFYKTKRGQQFWDYAQKTPFYDIVVEKTKKEKKSIVTLIKYWVVSLLAKCRVKIK